MATAIFWKGQFHILLILYFASSALFLCFKRGGSIGLLLFFRFVLFGLIGYPQGTYMGIEMVLIHPLILELIFLVKKPWNLPSAWAAVLVSLIFQLPMQAWNVRLEAPGIQDILLYLFVAGMGIFLSHSYRRVLDQLASASRSNRQLEQAVVGLTKTNTDFQQYAKMIGVESSAQERKRIARDIHDTIGHMLINLNMLTEQALLLLAKSEGEAARVLKNMQELTGAGLIETRKALRELHRIDEQRLPLSNAIQKLSSNFEEVTGIATTVEYSNLPPRLDEDLEEALYHLIQEGMTNSFRHGKAGKLSIQFFSDERGIYVYILDNGKGSASIEKGIGIMGMEERLSKFGGTVKAGNVSGGFQLRAFIPHGRS